MKLTDKVAVVSGGGRGIGRAICLRLAQEGAAVVVNYSRSAEAAEQTANEIARAGGQALALRADVCSGEEIAGLVSQVIERFQRIDVLVNNAGITRDKLLMRMTEADWDDVLDTNLKGVFLLSKAVVPYMVKQRSGVIVNIGSVVGAIGAPGQANYAASKAGLAGFTKSLARELGSRNIRVNTVAPGFIETEMTDSLKPEYKDEIKRKVALGRFGDAAEVASVTAFLCSPDAAYIHGQVLSVDGGIFA
ncbi:MAG TPA: 3-oxoacyl-[acyl-carrier-protein] reductase [Chthonomonadales bacterium]|nr:3-oxoacyl-[acyl-carrier-protein] reductase [Chthonomonadales bacterium]